LRLDDAKRVQELVGDYEIARTTLHVDGKTILGLRIHNGGGEAPEEAFLHAPILFSSGMSFSMKLSCWPMRAEDA
ncbi:MAG: hypothetical protein K6T83_19205, partial [Alicyclobacillus sp.]|nr:hypothetical protein [Alicyclobacillus sp.]